MGQCPPARMRRSKEHSQQPLLRHTASHCLCSPVPLHLCIQLLDLVPQTPRSNFPPMRPGFQHGARQEPCGLTRELRGQGRLQSLQRRCRSRVRAARPGNFSLQQTQHPHNPTRQTARHPNGGNPCAVAVRRCRAAAGGGWFGPCAEAVRLRPRKHVSVNIQKNSKTTSSCPASTSDFRKLILNFRTGGAVYCSAGNNSSRGTDCRGSRFRRDAATLAPNDTLRMAIPKGVFFLSTETFLARPAGANRAAGAPS
jgi:hypothetical protein